MPPVKSHQPPHYLIKNEQSLITFKGKGYYIYGKMLLHLGSFITLGLLHDVSFPVRPPELRHGPLASFSTLKQMGIVANKLEREWSLTVFSLIISLPSSLSSGPYWLNCLVNRPVASPVTPSKQLEINERFPQGPNKRGRLSQFEHTDYFLSSYLVTYILVTLYNR